MNKAFDTQIGSREWLDVIGQGAAQMGLTVSHAQAAQFAHHAQLLLQWNSKINLTAITDPIQVAVKHYLDAIAPLSHIPSQGCLLDIGTGGGFPGIPLKIMRPRQPMTLIDGVRKKINFVKHVIRELDLNRIEALHTRAEDLKNRATHKAGFDVIVCRALADLNAVVHLALPMLRQDGCILAYHGPRAVIQDSDDMVNVSIKEHRGHLQRLTHTYRLPVFGDNRAVSILRIT